MRFVLNGALLLAATLFQGVWIDSLPGLLLPTIVLVVVNVPLPLLMVLLGLPLRPLHITVATVVVNLLLLVLLDWLIPPFHAQGPVAVLGTTIVVAGVNYWLNRLVYRGSVERTR